VAGDFRPRDGSKEAQSINSFIHTNLCSVPDFIVCSGAYGHLSEIR
jgi:hypothetical protein